MNVDAYGVRGNLLAERLRIRGMLTLSSANGVYRLRSLELHDIMMLLHLPRNSGSACDVDARGRLVALPRSDDLRLTTLRMIDSCMYGIKYTEVPNMIYMEEHLFSRNRLTKRRISA
jgi:hypothetical protein